MLILMFVLSNGALIYGLSSLPTTQQVYLRNLMFSDIFSDLNLEDFNEVLLQGFKRDTDISQYINFINPSSFQKLKEKPYPSDRELAWAIVGVIGRPDGSVCGLETLGKTVYETLRGKGCCSDYSKAWLFYANLLGMRAREVSTFNHTTVEYLNRATGQWQWLDPFNQTEFRDIKGRVLSILEVRNSRYDEELLVNRPFESDFFFDANGYLGYSRAQMGVVFWRRGVNFLELETLDAQLRHWGLPKSVRQFLALVAGVQPRWLMVVTEADYFYYKLLKSLVLMLIFFWLAFNLVLLTISFFWAKRFFIMSRNQSSF